MKNSLPSTHSIQTHAPSPRKAARASTHAPNRTLRLSLELSAVIVTVTHNEPRVMLGNAHALPSGSFSWEHPTLEQALRAWAASQAAMQLGYVEQLYTFADKDRGARDSRIISIGYLALVTDHDATRGFEDWYKFFPWEDRRTGPSEPLMRQIHKGLAAWRADAVDRAVRQSREARIALTFPKDPKAWNEELVLQRYELLWEAGLLEEARRSPQRETSLPCLPGLAMPHDHRRILATGMARLRAKIKYRPVVFELMPPAFTLLQLQTTLEAIAGLPLHKQNFRRLILGQGLVEPVPGQSQSAKGRPAQLFAFRREILQARALVGTKLPRGG